MRVLVTGATSLIGRHTVDQSLDEVEAHPAHTGSVQVGEVGIRHIAAHRGHPASAAFAAAQRVDESAVVGAVAGGLHDDVPVESELITQREELVG